eukprot:1160796-Pelagomonas_calceolata.AAC.1
MSLPTTASPRTRPPARAPRPVTGGCLVLSGLGGAVRAIQKACHCLRKLGPVKVCLLALFRNPHLASTCQVSVTRLFLSDPTDESRVVCQVLGLLSSTSNLQLQSQLWHAMAFCPRCVSDGGMGSCFSEDVSKYVPFCNKDAKKAEPAALITSDAPSYMCFSKNETTCKDAKACDW